MGIETVVNLPIHEFSERTKLLKKLEANDVTILIGKVRKKFIFL